MPQTDHRTELAAQRRLARKYRALGYDVQENPGPDRLPDFMRGAAPDIVARSQSDNVVIEVKRHAALKGSNDLVSIAEQVAGHPEWRFELIVLGDDQDGNTSSEKHSDALLTEIRTATSHGLFEMSFVYMVNELVRSARALAKSRGMSAVDKGGRTLFLDLGFKGILPDIIVEKCLAALDVLNHSVHTSARADTASEADVHSLIQLYDEIRAFR